MSARIQVLVKDLHYKYAKWLCLNYRVMLLHHYNVRDMVRRSGRKIGRGTVRSMLSWSPCAFRDRLIGMSRRYPRCHVIQVSEDYTSKTCRCCGFLHRKLGGSKMFKCPTCHASYPRDEGGASNIFLRYATRLHSSGVGECTADAQDSTRYGIRLKHARTTRATATLDERMIDIDIDTVTDIAADIAETCSIDICS